MGAGGSCNVKIPEGQAFCDPLSGMDVSKRNGKKNGLKRLQSHNEDDSYPPTRLDVPVMNDYLKDKRMLDLRAFPQRGCLAGCPVGNPGLPTCFPPQPAQQMHHYRGGQRDHQM
jgi:hypothetical protein